MTTSGATPTSFSAWRSLSRRLACALVGTGEAVASLLYPRECVLCGSSIDGREIICERCCDALPALAPHRCSACGEPLEDPLIDLCLTCGTRARGFESFLALGPYAKGWDRLIRAFKFDRERAVGHWLGDRMADCVREAEGIGPIDAVTFVPMTRSERRSRTFNQAEILARRVSQQLGLPLCKLLVKTRRTSPQSHLPAHARKTNLVEAFRAQRGQRWENVLLVDDICTTGATVEACSLALKRGGHGAVIVLTAARA